MNPTLFELAQQLTATARDRGARAAQVYGCTRKITDLGSRGGRPSPKHSDAEHLAVTVWLADGRTSTAVGTPHQGTHLVDEALSDAAAGTPDPNAAPIERLEGAGRSLDINDRRGLQITDADRAETLLSNLTAAQSVDKRVKTGRFWWQDVVEQRALVNTKGVELQEQTTTFRMGGEVTVDTPRPITLSDECASRSFSTTACLPFGARLARWGEALLADEIDHTGPVRVLLRPRACAAILAWISARVTDECAAPGSTFIRDMLPFHPKIHLIDDGSLPGGLKTRGFDDHGVPPQPLVLFREGHVHGSMMATLEAQRQSRRPSGHMWDGRLQTTNLFLNGGVRSIHARLGELEGPVLSLDHLPWELNIDPATGDIDQVVHGQWFDGQEPAGVITHRHLRGNLVEALRRVVRVASDTDRHLHVDAPGLFLDGLSLD